ncbi:hypothetical protein DsansV1_C17g0143301 [Dioscorea sansibarensis]
MKKIHRIYLIHSTDDIEANLATGHAHGMDEFFPQMENLYLPT